MALFTMIVMLPLNEPAQKHAASFEFQTTGEPVSAELVDHSAVTVSHV